MKKRVLIPIIFILCAIVFSACGNNKDASIENISTDTEDGTEEDTTKEGASEASTAATTSTEEATTTEEEAKTSTEEKKTSAEDKKSSTEEKKTATEQPSSSAHSHNFVGGDCSHPSTCSCGATGSYGSHNWNTRTWTEQIVHPGAEVCKGEYDEGIHCKECYYGYSDGASYQDVIVHIDATGHIGWSNHAIPIMVTEAPWTETVTRSETTCTICGAKH